MGPAAMSFQVKLSFQGVVDRLDELAQWLQESGTGAGGLPFSGRSDEFGVVVVENGLELGTGIALVGKDRLPRAADEVLLLVLEEIVDVVLSNVHVPSMLVRGLLSDVVTEEGVDDLLARIPDATVVGVDGAAHMIAGDRNDAFSDAVIAFLRDRVRPTID